GAAGEPRRDPSVPGGVTVPIPIEQILVQTVNGIVSGMILALVASGLTLIFGIMDVVNFAHGELVMLGAFVCATTLTCTRSLWLFLRRGKYGIWIRAATQDRIMASAMGIPVPLVHTLVFAIGAGMAAASGVLFGPLGGVTQTMGFDFTLRAFIVVVVGGMGNLGGSILASIFVSLLEAYAALVVSPAQAVIVSFVVLVLTMLFRPTGLFVPTPK